MTRPLAAAAAAVVLLAGCGGGGGADRGPGGTVRAEGPPDAQTATVVSNDDLRYDPGIVQASPGTLTLTHRNGGKVPHNLVFSDDSLGAIDTVTEGQSKSITLTFSEPGTYDFVCTFHSGQVGEVVVE